MQQVAEQPAPIEPVATSVTAFIDCFCDGPLDRAVRIAGIDDFERTFGGFDPPSEASYALDQFFCNGGRQTWVVRTQAADGSPPDAAALIGDSAAGTGLHALDEADFNLLCMPRAANTTGASADLTAQEARAVIGAAIAYCERRRALFLVDPPVGVADAREMAGWLEHNPALRHPNTALYYPRVRVADPLDGLRLRTLGASGTIAGLVARIDRARGVWEAPSGSEAVLHGVSELAHELTDGESGVLGRLGINPLRGTPQGIICWGARTLAGADGSSSEWRYVPVRRLALMLEESLERGTRWAMFEPNDEPLWSRLRVATGAFMDGLFRQGAFGGRGPRTPTSSGATPRPPPRPTSSAGS